MTSQLVFDYAAGPFNKLGRFTVSLEVEGERFLLESAYSTDGIKGLAEKWGRFGKALNLPTTTTDAARKVLDAADQVSRAGGP